MPEIVIPYRPRKQFLAIHNRKKRWGICVAHVRAGKTVACINELIKAAVQCPRRDPRFAYVAPYYSQAKDVAWSYLKYYTERIPGREVNESELRVDLPGGKRVRLYGADNYQRLSGISLDGVVLDEFGDMDPRAWKEVIRARLSDRNGWAMFIGTPKGMNHFGELWAEAQLDPEWLTLKLPASETGILPQQELDSARKAMSEEDYAAQYECFPAGTMVATTRGNIPIESIRIGDSVLTHRGRWRPVTATMRREHDGELVSVDAYGLTTPLRCTANHPFLVHDKTTQEREWCDAYDLRQGDCLVLPRVRSPLPIVSEAMARLIAWFICEGSVSGNAVSFSCNPLNAEELARVRGIIEDCGYQSVTYPSAPGTIVVANTALADMLGAWCGLKARNKRIPFDIIAGHESIVFAEMMLGDGCSVEPVQGGHRWAYSTISRGLALDVQLLAGSLQRRAGIVTRRATVMVSPNNGQEYPASESYCVQIPKGMKVNHSGRQHECFPTGHGMAYRIRRVSTEPFCGLVYNLSVKEDESYVANGRAVHNCSFEASVVGAYWGREMQQAETDGRITRVPYQPEIAVETWWDLGVDDATAIWFTQTVGREVHVIDYYEASGEGLPHYARVLQNRGYVYAAHHAPHDIRVRELGSGRSRLETGLSLGMRFEVVPDIPRQDGIDAARSFLARCWFDRENTQQGRMSLVSYRKLWDEKRKVFSSVPLHDWASNGADAWRYLAVGHKITVQRQRAEEMSHRRAMVSGSDQRLGWMGA